MSNSDDDGFDLTNLKNVLLSSVKKSKVKKSSKRKWRRIVVPSSSSSEDDSICKEPENQLNNFSSSSYQEEKEKSKHYEERESRLKTQKDCFVDDNDLDEISTSILIEESLVDTKLSTSDEEVEEKGEQKTCHDSTEDSSSDDVWKKSFARAELIFSGKKGKKNKNQIDQNASLDCTYPSQSSDELAYSTSKSSKKPHFIRKKLGITFPLDEPVPKSFLVSTKNKNLTSLFQSANVELFDGKLDNVTVSWSGRLTSSAGIFHGLRNEGKAYINLSYKLLCHEPAIHFIETLLHEMIHAYLFITETRDKSSHGPNFRRKMNEINDRTGFNVSITHDYHDAVNSLQKYVWRCDGVCRSQASYNYGFIKRSVNRPPNPNDIFFSRHTKLCGGQYKQITTGPEYEFAMSSIK